MCGICGFFSLDGNADASAVYSMAQLLRHRGPDDEGYVAVSSHDGTVACLGGTDSQVSLPHVSSFSGGADLYLAHRRLSVIDLSPAGHQPMGYDQGNLWVTFNGELYNYIKLRSDLERLGYGFKTGTDTEVLLAAYNEWGEKCLDRLDGMWAFVLYDRRRNLLFGSRDRFGVKPLYYIKSDNHFAFASEVKAFVPLPGFRRTVRPNAIVEYLSFGMDCWCDGRTFFQEVMELPPSHAFRLDLVNNRLHIYRYYQLPCNDGNHWETFREDRGREYVQQVRNLVISSVRRHLVSDVPVGSCLSGGIDSSSIFCTIGEILKGEKMTQVGDRPKAFTACYDDASIDESNWARLAAGHAGGVWHPVYPKGEDLLDDLVDLVYTQDFPFGSTSIYAQYRVMKLAKEAGVTVLLDGQGGDELFTGYDPYYVAFFREMVAKGAWRELVLELKGLNNAPIGIKNLLFQISFSLLRERLPRAVKLLGLERRNPIFRYISQDLRAAYVDEISDVMLGRHYAYGSLNHMLWSLMTDKSLPRLLRYEDRNSMRFQIEARTPFADDRELIESVFSIPSVYKIHNGFSKWLLREAMRPFLPQEIYTRKDKIGFATPELSWFRANSGRLKTIISDRISDYVDVKKITADWDSLLANQPKFGIFCLWRVINLAMWLDVSA